MSTHDTDQVSSHFKKLSSLRDSAVRDVSSYTPSTGGYMYSSSAAYKPQEASMTNGILRLSTDPYAANLPSSHRYANTLLYRSSIEPVKERTIVIGNPSRSTSPVFPSGDNSRSPSRNAKSDISNHTFRPSEVAGDIPTKTVIQQEGYIIHKVPTQGVSHVYGLHPTKEKVVTKVTVTSTEGDTTDEGTSGGVSEGFRYYPRSQSANVSSWQRPQSYGTSIKTLKSSIIAGNSTDMQGGLKTINSNFSYNNGLGRRGISQLNYDNTRYGNNQYNITYTTNIKPLSLQSNSRAVSSIPYSRTRYVSPLCGRFSKDTSLVSTPIRSTRSRSIGTLQSLPLSNYMTGTPLMSAENTGLLEAIDRNRMSQQVAPCVTNRVPAVNTHPVTRVTESDMLMQGRSRKQHSLNLVDVVAQEPPANNEHPLSADPVQRSVAEFNGIMMPVPLSLPEDDLINFKDGGRSRSWSNNNRNTCPPTVVDCVVVCREMNGGVFDPRRVYGSNTDVGKITPPSIRIVDAYERALLRGTDMVLYSTGSVPLLRHIRLDFKISPSSGSRSASFHPILVWFKKGSSYTVLGRVSLGDIIAITNGYNDCPALIRYVLVGNREHEDEPQRRIGGLNGRGILGPRLGGNRPVVLSTNNVIRMLFMGGVELSWVALDPVVAHAWMMVLEYILIEMRPKH